MRPSEILKERYGEVQAIARKYKGIGLKRLLVFGSVARGEDTEGSDIDFIIDSAADGRLSAFRLMDIRHDLESLLGCDIDLLTSGCLYGRAQDSFRRSVLGDAKVIA